jgi:hypothetical protein
VATTLRTWFYDKVLVDFFVMSKTHSAIEIQCQLIEVCSVSAASENGADG